MLTAENEMECCLNSTSQTGEHNNMSNVCVCVPFLVIFVVAIILLSFLLFAGYPQLQQGIYRLKSTLQVKISETLVFE